MTPCNNASSRSSRRSTVVCVTNQFQCERIIRAGKIVADLSNTALKVIHVSSSDFQEQNIEAIEYLYEISRQSGAEMTVIYSEEPLKALSGFIRNNKAQNVLSGMPQKRGSILQKLWNKFSHVSFFTVEPNGEIRPVTEKDGVESA